MNFRFLLPVIFLYAGLFSFAQQGERPNILVFVADDAGMHYSAYGDEAAQTPHIDALAAGGLRCEQAFLTTPQCSPSRTSILSGKFAHTIGTEDLHTGLDEHTQLLPAYLRTAGYYTGFMLKGHLGENGHRQFDWHEAPYREGNSLAAWNERHTEFMNIFLDSAGTRPFFLWVGFIDPHRPYRDSSIGASPRVDPDEVSVPPYLSDDTATRRDLAAYYNEISRMDEQIGRLLEILEERGKRDNTLIIFLSDNGFPFPGGKGTLYDAGIQTPLIFNWTDRIRPGSKYAGLLSVIDLAPTILEVTGVPIPDGWYGRSFRGIFNDTALPGRTHVFAERNWHNCDEHMRSVRTPRYKLIRNAYTELPLGNPADVSMSPAWYALKEKQREDLLTPAQARLFRAPRPAVELYDLENDPHELVNLAGHPEYQELVRELSQELDRWRTTTGDHPWWQRRRPDNTDRVTGVKYLYRNPGFWKE